MTKDEFERERDEELAVLPEEFRDFVSSNAWERGHACGYDEVMIYIREWCDGLLPCIEKYTGTIA